MDHINVDSVDFFCPNFACKYKDIFISLMTPSYGYVYLHLRYGVICWGNPTVAQQFFMHQKRIIRAIFKINSVKACNYLFKILNFNFP